MGLDNVVHVGGGHCDRMDVACSGIRTGMDLHAEVPLIPLLRGVHLRVTGLCRVLGRTRCMNDGCVNDCTAVHDEPRGVQPLFHVIKDLARDVVFFQQVAEVKECRGIGCLFSGEVDLQEVFHGVAVIDGILDSLVRETEPVLQEVHTQHCLKRDQFSAALFLDIVRRDECHPFVPRNDGFHGLQKGFTPCCSLAVCVLHGGKCLLRHFVSLPHRIASSSYCNLSETKHATKEFISVSLRHHSRSQLN